MRGKLFNNYKKYKLHVVKKMFRAHYNVQNLIAEKSCFFLKTNSHSVLVKLKTYEKLEDV